MNFKIVKTQNGIDVLVRREWENFDDENKERVVVSTFVTDCEDMEFQFEETIPFENERQAVRYVEDFSQKSADQFLEERLEEDGVVLPD